jgi:hypothetical protein
MSLPVKVNGDNLRCDGRRQLVPAGSCDGSDNLLLSMTRATASTALTIENEIRCASRSRETLRGEKDPERL